MAGNQVGKTIGGGNEAAMHATGLYPDWWEGHRFDKPTVGWAAGLTGESTRDNPQRILLGRPTLGTGAIPAKFLGRTLTAPGVPEGIALATVTHVPTNKESLILFKSYAQGREKWQGDSIDWIWFDEEPPEDIYSEGLTRIAATKGRSWITFTPLNGMTNVVLSFLRNPVPEKAVVTMTIDEAEHYTPEDRVKIIRGWPEHEREARSRGIPTLGSGKIFPVTESSIEYSEVPISKYWKRIVGWDFGWDHPSAGVWMAYDMDADIVYVYDCYRASQTSVASHAIVIRGKGEWIPVSWPHDGLQHDKGSGEQLAQQYRNAGVRMLADRATFDDGTNGVEAGIAEMLNRMETGRLKIAKHLVDWWEEFRIYHRADGKVVKRQDDLMAATRYGLMMLRFAKNEAAKGNIIKYPERRRA